MRPAIASAAWATACSSGRSRWRSASTSTACGCAAWPRACSLRSRATIRCSAIENGPCSAARCDCAPTAPPTTSAPSWPRSPRRATCGCARYPRGDLRRSTEHVPSRFLAATIAAVGADVRSSPSYRVRRHPRRVPREPPRARSARRGRRRGVGRVPSPRSRAALELTEARAGSAFTRFDGNLADCRRPPARDQPRESRTGRRRRRGLQTWAACPHAYFMDTVLHVEPVEQPEDVMQLAPIDRGTLVHEVLDRFLGEVRGRASMPGGRGPTPIVLACARSRSEVSAETEARGLTGRRLLWHRDRRLIFAELDAFLDADEAFRAGRRRGDARDRARVRDVGSPTRSGRSRSQLGDGRIVRVRGKADRVDRRADGTPRRHRLQDRVGQRSYKIAHPRRTGHGGHASATPRVRVRGARRVRHARHRGRGAITGSSGKGKNRASATPSTIRSTRSSRPRCGRSSTASKPECSRRCPPNRPRRRSSSATSATPTGWARPTAGGSGSASSARPSSRDSAAPGRSTPMRISSDE